MSKLITISESEFDALTARVKELEAGPCRFNCRTEKVAYIAGFRDACRASWEKPFAEEFYEEWKGES